MQEITELERRITAALARVGAGVDGVLKAQSAADAAAAAAAQGEADAIEQQMAIDMLERELSRERAMGDELRERLAAARTQEAADRDRHDEEMLKLLEQLDNQGVELQRMRKSAVALREELRALREAQANGIVDAAMINRALQAEVDALRASRLSELAELEELTAALEVHLSEAAHA